MDPIKAVELYMAAGPNREPSVGVSIHADGTVHPANPMERHLGRYTRLPARQALAQVVSAAELFESSPEFVQVHEVATHAASYEELKGAPVSVESVQALKRLSTLVQVGAVTVETNQLRKQVRLQIIDQEVALDPEGERARITLERSVRSVMRSFYDAHPDPWDAEHQTTSKITDAWETVTLRPEKVGEEIPWIVRYLDEDPNDLVLPGETLEDAAKRISTTLTARLQKLLAAPDATVGTWMTLFESEYDDTADPDTAKIYRLWPWWRSGDTLAVRVSGGLAHYLHTVDMWSHVKESDPAILETFVALWDARRLYDPDDEALPSVLQYPEKALQAAYDVSR